MTRSSLSELAFHVTPADWRVDFDALRAVREAVFLIEQKVPVEDEWDEADPDCLHVLAVDAGGAPIGTARMERSGKIGRMAVLADWRGRGVGAAMLQALLDLARQHDLDAVHCHAQVSALEFYRRFGFEPEGERFMEAGIEHQLMRLPLPRRELPPRAPSDLPPQQAAAPFQGIEPAVAAVVAAVAPARQTLRLVSRDLEPTLFGHAEVLAALRGFATGQRGARVLILVQEPVAAQAHRNRLFALAQRLTSCFEFRTPVEPQDVDYPAAYLVGDRGGFVYRPLAARIEGEASACLPARARELIGHFDPIWERSRPCTEFRALGI